MWEFFGTSPISGTTILSDKGYITKGVAKREKNFIHFIDKERGVFSSTTDVRRAKYKRNKKIEEFYQEYRQKYFNTSVSIIDVYLPIQSKKDSFKKFSSHLRRVLKTKKHSLLGYLWVRDIGEKEFKHHYHVLIALNRVSAENSTLPSELLFERLWKGSKSRFVVSFYKAKQYLKAKFIPIDCYNFRANGNSITFK
jgi:hypothetical protein